MTMTISIDDPIDLIDADQLEKVIRCLDKLEDKYESLVWYARRDFKHLPGVPQDIIEGAKNAAAQVEEIYIDEVQRLKDPHWGNWTHGFNSGMLAGLRLVLEALTPEVEIDDEENGGTYVIGGLDSALESFPELDT